MAEGWARHLYGDTIEVASAGVEKDGRDLRAVKIMAEAGIDISSHKSKRIDDLPNLEYDYVITLFDETKESCPFFPGDAKLIHAGFPDPVALAKDAPDEDQKLTLYRRVRDETAVFLEKLPEALPKLSDE
jgi:arsenate reductase (thioredoxin)